MYFKVLGVCFIFVSFMESSLCVKEVPYMYCEDGNTLLTLVVNPCLKTSPDENAVCVFKHGNKVKVDAAFVSPFTSGNLETVSTATFKGHVIPFPDSGNNPCQKNIIPKCPVVKGNAYILTYHMDVLKYYPTGPMDIEFSVRDKKTKQVLACAKVSIVIQRNPELSYA